MTLQEAIVYLQKNTVPEWTGIQVAVNGKPDTVDHAIATILNAVVKGELK